MSKNLRWYQPAYWLRATIRGYQRFISPRTAANCRYLPTCSAYAIEAIEVHGAAQGGWMTTKRVLSCNPWGTKGLVHQPVPPRRETADA